MSNDGKLQLDMLDVYGNHLKENVDIRLRHRELSDVRLYRNVDASKTVLIKELFGAPRGLYQIEIDPPSYLPVSQFLNLNASDPTKVEISFPIDPKKVREVKFPTYENLLEKLKSVLDASEIIINGKKKKGQKLYQALDDISRAGLLNIARKAQATPLTNGRNVFSYLTNLIEIRGDRFFAFVSSELAGAIESSLAEELFDRADGSLHEPPPEYRNTFKLGRSYKTPDKYGNLQVTFFTNHSDYLVDIDIDDAGGLGHIFQVLRNFLTQRPTHPYDIHEILIAYQKLDPGYSFVL